MTNHTSPSLDAALDLIGLDRGGLRVEGFRTDGTSNYLANLNFRGQTWAAALRMPAYGASIGEFLQEKGQALLAVSYLLDSLPSPVDVGFDCVLKFGGVSTLVENSSVQAFLREQEKCEPLCLRNEIDGSERRIEGQRYPESLSPDTREYVASYGGPYYLSRGAPAWETLEEYPELEEPAAHALAELHKRTGSGVPIPMEGALTALDHIRTHLALQADAWTPLDGTKESAALAKSMKKWSGTEDRTRAKVIKWERYLRTSVGRDGYRKLFEEHVRPLVSDDHLRCFCHGDSHGGNYVIVRYQYSFAGQETLVDRVFLNEIFMRHLELEEIVVSFDRTLTKMSFGPQSGPVGNGDLIARRRLHHEIHPIDLDAGTGTTEATKEAHLYDGLMFSISLQNITELFANTVTAREVLAHYYDGLLR